MALQNAFGDLALDATLLATNGKLDNILAELNQKFEAGEEVALDATTIAALQSVTAIISNMPTDFPDAAVLAKLELIRALLAAPLAVTGTFFPATQPVSGTFWQATQPVSAVALPLPAGAATEAKQDALNAKLPAALGQQAAANSLAVAPSNESLQDVYVTGAATQTTLGNNLLLAVAGATGYDTLSQSGLGISLRTMFVQIVPTGTIAGGTIIFEASNDNVTFTPIYLYDEAVSNSQVAASVNLTTGTNRFWAGPTKFRYVKFRLSVAVTGGGSVQAFIRYSPKPYVPTVMSVGQTSSLLIVQPPGITKGTQSAQGFTIQPLRDGGRVRTLFSATGVAAGTTGTETAISLTKAADNGATSSANSFVITSAKRFRIEAINFCSRGHNTATPQVTTFSFRINTAGAVTTTSTPIILSVRSATIASNEWDRVTVPIPDGMEILGDGTIQFGITANAVFTTNAPTWDVNIIGFEY